MNPNPDYRLKHFGSQRTRTLQGALVQRLGSEFPRLGGARILELCAQMIMEIIDDHFAPRERLAHGQVIWNAVDLEERPRRHCTGVLIRTRPVILTLHDPSDVEDCLVQPRGKAHWNALRRKRAIRLCREAHAQGGLLSNVDLSLLLSWDDCWIGQQLSAWEKEHDELVPRRANLHDLGSGVTHKRIICRKRHLEGKDPAQVARETWHSLQAVDRYLGAYDRVRHCLQQGMTTEQTAHLLSCSIALVREYIKIDEEISEARKDQQPNPLP
jgi:hypothetical protein